MKLATIRDGASTKAVRIDGDQAVDLGVPDVGAVLARDDWQSWAAAADGPRRPVDGLDYAPLILRPDKVLCVGLNYRSHILETGNQVPTHPTLFSKFTSALIGANDDVAMPPESEKVDWEAELTVVIGKRGRRIPQERAADYIAGYTIMNDVSIRDFQMRTAQWLQGKSWESSTPLGPWLVTSDESPGPSREISCEVNGEQKQKADTADLVFDPGRARRVRVDHPHARAGRRDRDGHTGRRGHAVGHVPRRWRRDGDADRRPGGVPERLPSGSGLSQTSGLPGSSPSRVRP